MGINDEVPIGAVENGAVFLNRIEQDYNFECDAGSIAICSDWIELRRCFEVMSDYIRHGSDKRQQAAEAKLAQIKAQKPKRKPVPPSKETAMTRDELIEKVAVIIRGHDPDYDTYAETAQDILNAIFAALKEPTEEMIDAFFEQQSYEETADKSWKLMLSSSPLAPS